MKTARAIWILPAILMASVHLSRVGAESVPATNLISVLESYTAEKYPAQDLRDFLFVSVGRQRMYRLTDWVILRSYRISSAARGVGNLTGSLQTPLGLHRICQKIGQGVPPGGILRARRYTGTVAKIYTDSTEVKKDDVTSRILWLCGMEPGVNRGGQVDSHQRFIYIHGTPEEGLLGSPASDGCIRMRNDEVIELFESATVGLPVLILESP